MNTLQLLSMVSMIKLFMKLLCSLYIIIGQCFSGSFMCDNGECRSQSAVCDSHNNCGDNSDEQGCPPPGIYTVAKACC